jgi:hypothetical protein
MKPQREISMMLELSELEHRARIFSVCTEGEAETEVEFSKHQAIAVRLWDDFCHALAIRGLTYEEYRAYWPLPPAVDIKATDEVPF